MSTDASTLIEIVDAQDKLLIRDVVSGDVDLAPIGNPRCVRARTRDAAGRVSAVTELCSPKLASRPAATAERNSGLMCESGELVPEDHERRSDADGGAAPSSRAGDCSAAVGGGQPSLWFALGLLGMVRLRRRVR